MITGFNTDVEYKGRTYHVQTEDRGLASPIIESLVYTGGEIVSSRKGTYADLIASGTFTEEALRRRMEAQHRELMLEIQRGKFDDGSEQMPFGYSIVTTRSFDEVVLEFLQSNAAPAAARELSAPTP